MNNNSLNFQRLSSKRLKIVILGEGGVGKTTIAESYKRNSPFHDTKQTVAIEFHTKREEKDGEILILQIWDLAGQKQFRDMGVFETYCKGSHGALLCFDLTDISTFLELPKWAKFLKNDVPRILIGTKNDLYNSDPLLEEDIYRFCDDYNVVLFLKTTVYDINTINTAFIKLITHTLEANGISLESFSRISLLQKKFNRFSIRS